MDVVEFFVIILIAGALALLIGPRFMKRGPKTAADAVQGTLLITGISPRPDTTGEQFVTISGVINGPGLSEHVVYQRMVVDVDSWPSMGDLIPVMYSAKNPDNWRFGPLDTPPTEKPLL